MRPSLFDEPKRAPLQILEKIPFHYRYEIDTPNGVEQNRYLITDWEAGELYRNCLQLYGVDGWEEKFRQKLETSFMEKDLHFVMGTVHRFPDQWLIISIVYPPRTTQPALEL